MAGTSHVLARKYRPQVFSDLIGQEALVRTITNAIATNRLAHAYMLTGIRGVGKTSSARIIAKGLNCTGPDGKGGMTPNPCGQCQNCRDIANDAHIDVIEIDAASNTGVDNVREIIDGAKYNPVSARFKIYIIDEVHMLSKQAFNALLKTLEEPPERIKFIFATTEIRKVPITILSRCQRFDLRRLDEQQLADHLAHIAQMENTTFEPEALQLLARAGDGSVRDSLSLMDQAMTQLDNNLTADGVRHMLGLADRTVLFDLYDTMMKGDIAGALQTLDAQYDCGADPFVLTQDLLELTHWLTRIKIVPTLADDVTVPEAERKRGKQMAEQLSMASLTSAWQMLLKGLTEVKNADFPLKALEMLIIRLAYMADLPAPAQLIEDIKKNGLATPPSVNPTIIRPIDPTQTTHPATNQPATPATTATPIPTTQSAPSITKATEVPANTNGGIGQLSDVVTLARAKGERMLAFQVESYIRPVSVQPGLIKCVLTPDAPRSLCQQLSQFLTAHTSREWIVQTQVSGGSQTLQEVKEAKQNAVVADLKQTPIIAGILAAFPGSKVEKVKPIKSEDSFIGEEDNLPPTDEETDD